MSTQSATIPLPALPAIALLAACSVCGCVALRRSPVNENVLVARQLAQQGMQSLYSGNLSKAEEKFSQALDECPEDAQTHRQMADCLWKRGSTHEAVEHLKQALSYSRRKDPGLLLRLAEMQFALEETEAAEDLLHKVLSSGGANATAWTLQGKIAQQRGDLDEALKNYHRALVSEPENLEIQFALAEIHMLRNNSRRALATLNRIEHQLVDAQAPDHLLVLRGIALRNMHRYQEAAEQLKVAVTRDGRNASVHLLLAECQHAAGDIDGARLTLAAVSPLTDARLEDRFRRIASRIEADSRRRY